MPNNDVFKIAISGPESCGKSTLAKQLAAHFNTNYVEEYARKFLEKNGNQWDYDTILFLAKTQIEEENKAIESSNRFLFCDTDLINFKIWLEFEGYKVPGWLLKAIEAKPYQLTLLCKPDIPWRADKLRGFPQKRNFFFDKFKTELEDFGYSFCIVSGENKVRLENAIHCLDSLLHKSNS